MPQQTVLISASQLDNIQLCTRLHYFKDILYLAPMEGKSEGLEKGDLFHYLLDLHYKSLIASNSTSLIDVGLVEELGLNKATELSLEDEEAKGIIFLYKEYRDFYPFEESVWEPEESEVPFAVVVFEDEDLKIILQGKIDLLAKNKKINLPLVIDHKYSSKNYPVSSRDTQNLSYCLATGRRDFIINQAGDQKSYSPDKRFLRPSFCYSEDKVNEFRDDVIYWTLEIIKNHFRSANGDHIPANRKACKFFNKPCTYWDLCETSKDNLEGKIESDFMRTDKLRKGLFG